MDICTCWLHFDNKSVLNELVLTLQAQFLRNRSFTFQSYSDFGRKCKGFIYLKATGWVISFLGNCCAVSWASENVDRLLFNNYKRKEKRYLPDLIHLRMPCVLPLHYSIACDNLRKLIATWSRGSQQPVSACVTFTQYKRCCILRIFCAFLA